MARLLSNYSSNGNTLTDEYGTLFGLSDLIGNSGVIKGMQVVANSTPAMNVYVQTGSSAIGTGTAPSNYSYFVKIDTSGQGEQVTIATAAASPRIDYIVAYVNKSQAGTNSSPNNTNNVFMLADVQGTPAGSPVPPTTTQIQTAIGAANPYIILAQVLVGANVTQITNANITDSRTYSQVALQNVTVAGTYAAPLGTRVQLVATSNQNITGSGPQLVTGSQSAINLADFTVPGKTTYVRFHATVVRNNTSDILEAQVTANGSVLAACATNNSPSVGTNTTPWSSTTVFDMRSGEIAMPASTSGLVCLIWNKSSTTSGGYLTNAYLEVYWR